MSQIILYGCVHSVKRTLYNRIHAVRDGYCVSVPYRVYGHPPVLQLPPKWFHPPFIYSLKKRGNVAGSSL